MNEHAVTRETVTIEGPRGPIVGELAYTDAEPRGAVLLIGPHPYMGGTMDNNVVAGLAESLAASGYVTLRFNYLALSSDTVAESMLAFWTTGHTPQDIELIEEARAAQGWLRDQLGEAVSVIGYSFGAEAASEIVDDQTPAAVLIAPTVKHHDLVSLRSSGVPKLVVYSTDDFATHTLATESWFAKLAEPKAKHCFVGVNHFFKGCEQELADRIEAHLQTATTKTSTGVTP